MNVWMVFGPLTDIGFVGTTSSFQAYLELASFTRWAQDFKLLPGMWHILRPLSMKMNMWNISQIFAWSAG